MKQFQRRITVSILVLIFIVPMLIAWLSYSRGWFLVGHKVNHGTLMPSSISIDSLNLMNVKDGSPPIRGRWWLLYLTEEVKDPKTEQFIYYLRQIRQATGKDRARIERAIITLPKSEQGAIDQVLKNFPGTAHFIISNTKLAKLESILPKKLALTKSSLYLVDPLGNIVLFYGQNVTPKSILQDLQRVLKVSQIG